ncbi:DUF6634 family protein [Methylorubrum populi]
MFILNREPSPSPRLATAARKYRALADDLDAIARGQHPTADRLRDAPTLSRWRIVITPVPHLLGVVSGHPEIAEGHVCRTSAVFVFDSEKGYARTYSRFYRLGPR